jgi:hypothetical protein
MAVITDAVDTTSVADRTNTEWIDVATRYAAQQPFVWMELVTQKSLVGLRTDTYTKNIRTNLVAATAHTDSEEFTALDLASTDTNTATAEYGSASFVADRAERLSVEPEQLVAIESNVRACNLKIDTAVLALSTSMTTIGNAATNNTLSNFITVLTAFKATSFGSMSPPIMVLHLDAMRDLQQDAVTNGAAIFGAGFGDQLANATGGVNVGFLRPFGGVYLLETASVPAGDTTGWSNFIVTVGEQDGGIVMPVGMDINTELERVASRRGTWVTAAQEFGAGLLEAARSLRFVTRT